MIGQWIYWFCFKCVCTVFFWVHRMVIKNKDYPFTNDVMRIFQHKNDCQIPKQIINSVSEDGSLS
jgi:hypothetical protein